MKKSATWLSFDLGVRGDYEGLFTWLDDHHARECAGNTAFIQYSHEGPIFEAIQADLREAITVTKKARIYVIYLEPSTRKMKGKFIFGGRTAPPWAGFTTEPTQEDQDES